MVTYPAHERLDESIQEKFWNHSRNAQPGASKDFKHVEAFPEFVGFQLTKTPIVGWAIVCTFEKTA